MDYLPLVVVLSLALLYAMRRLRVRRLASIELELDKEELLANVEHLVTQNRSLASNCEGLVAALKARDLELRSNATTIDELVRQRNAFRDGLPEANGTFTADADYVAEGK